ncbi:AMP-binding protein [Fodinicola acaciae]|uniref:AMP-binding protein n=1 Tax=Fodinicola acaciae TaxID=2681555 RepID=UPI0013D08221|nr:AMP-binding protein [Fodinicola acaciae]
MYVGAIAAATPDKPAVIMAGTGESLTYGQLDRASNRLAHALFVAGLRPGDHIAFMVENRPEFYVLAWAAQRSGLYFTAISTRLKVDEVAYIIDNCEAKVFFTTPSYATVATEAARRCAGLNVKICLDEAVADFTPYDEFVEPWPQTPIERELEGSPMLYSSGTTGRPKGIKRQLTGLGMGQDERVLTLAVFFGLNDKSVYLSPAPLYHAAPLGFTMSMLRVGTTIILMDRFEPQTYLSLIERYRVTNSQVVPTMFIRLLKLPPEVREKYDVSSLRTVIHAAAPCPVEVKRAMIDWWGPILFEYYAGTENNGMVACTSEEWLAHPGTVGRPLVGEPHILDDNGDQVPVGTAGTIYFANGTEFEYHGDPEKTASSRDPRGRGWSTLGDVGYLDEDGFLYLTDRRAHMIISGGVNVYPQEAENVLAMHPKVTDVAVIGVPDSEMGESVKAVVQPVSMADAGPELAAELIAYCRERLAHYKCPLSVDFRPELPRLPTGKLQKRLLRDEYAKRDSP